MASKIKKFFKNIFSNRALIILFVFACMSAVLVIRIFDLQIVHGQEYAENFVVTTTKTRVLESTRGNIYDVNGKLIAYNELSNTISLEDNGSYDSTREKQLSLNGEIYKLINMIEGCGDEMYSDFHIGIDDNGNYTYDVGEGTTLNRFRADIYGLKSISDLSPTQLTATPNDIIDLLCSSDRFGLVNEANPYTEEELTSHGLPLSIKKSDVIKIISIRYRLSLTSFQKYLQIPIATDVSDATVALIEENIEELQGVAVTQDSKRVYNYAECMASIIGYTGRPSSEELAELLEIRDDYTSSSIIGKSGIEQYMETTLQGVDGYEVVAVDNRGKVLGVYSDQTVEPRKGDDLYLTIDADLQQACYDILEQRLAGIIISNIVDIKRTEDLGKSTDDSDYTIPIPIYDVYNAFIGNSMIDIDHFQSIDASTMEKYVYDRFLDRQQEIFTWLSNDLLSSTAAVFNDLDEEYQAYQTFVIDDLLTSEMEVLIPQGDYTSDPVYISWKEGSISMHDYLAHAIEQDWIDLSGLSEDALFVSTSELFDVINSSVMDELTENNYFAKLQYKYMLYDDIIFPENLIQILYDQGFLQKDEDYDKYARGEYSAYDLITAKIRSIEIRPKDLALDPCSGSIVITDPGTGNTKAIVSYPGYDNNKLANSMDTEYYWKLYDDQSTPFYNKATQQLTAPGSTFKPLMVAAGITEGVITDTTVINCDGVFGEGLLDENDYLHCWNLSGHGDETVTQALMNSCNVFFCTVGYELGIDLVGNYSSARQLSKIQQYASLLNLDAKTNIQMTESSPHVSDEMAISSSIGQGTHLYTTSELCRFAATLYNNGTSYDLNILDRVTDSDGNTLRTFEPHVSKIAELSDNVWSDIKTGMRLVITNNPIFEDFDVDLYGKTGTAEEAKDRPNHALFIGFAHNDRNSDIAFASRIAYGYASQNTQMFVKDVLEYYYSLKKNEEIFTGTAKTDAITSVVTD